MRRVFGFVAAALLTAVLAAPAAAADAASVDDGAADSLVLAVAQGEPLGPDPKPREADDNPARELAGYENPEVPFTWGAAWILTFTGLVGLALLAGLYYFTVYRPSQGDASHS